MRGGGRWKEDGFVTGDNLHRGQRTEAGRRQSDFPAILLPDRREPPQAGFYLEACSLFV